MKFAIDSILENKETTPSTSSDNFSQKTESTYLSAQSRKRTASTALDFDDRRENELDPIETKELIIDQRKNNEPIGQRTFVCARGPKYPKLIAETKIKQQSSRDCSQNPSTSSNCDDEDDLNGEETISDVSGTENEDERQCHRRK